VSLTTASCAVAAKQATANRIIAAASAAFGSAGATGQLYLVALPVRGPRPPAPGPQRITRASAGPLTVAMDLAADRAAVSPAAGPAPAMVFTAHRLYERRGTGSGAQSLLGMGGAATNLTALSPPLGGAAMNALAAAAASQTAGAPNPGTSRPWLELDFSRLPRVAQDQAAGSYAVNPVLLLRLARGTLTGSVKPLSGPAARRLPPGDVGYQVNFDLDKAEKGMTDADKQVVARTLGANAVFETVFPGAVWLTPSGGLDGMEVTFPQRLDQDTRAALVVVLSGLRTGPAAAVDVPSPEQTVSVSSLGALVHGVA
jgi:hypothetical protein